MIHASSCNNVIYTRLCHPSLSGYELRNLIMHPTVCRANSFKRSILHVEFNKSHVHVVLANDVQFSTNHW